MDQDQWIVVQQRQRFEIGSRTCAEAAWTAGAALFRLHKRAKYKRGKEGFKAKVIECGCSVRMGYYWKKLYEEYPEGIPEGNVSITALLRMAEGPKKWPKPGKKCEHCGYDGAQLELDLREAREEAAVNQIKNGRVRDDLDPKVKAFIAQRDAERQQTLGI